MAPSITSLLKFIQKHTFVVMGLAGGVVVLAFFVVFTVWGFWYRQWDGPVAERVAHLVPIPAARVDGSFVPYADYLTHLKAERLFLSGPVARAKGLSIEPMAIKALALNRAVRTKAAEFMAKKEGIVVTPLDTERVFQELIMRSASTTEAGEVETVLRENFGWNETEFKNYVLRPAMTEDTLNKKYEAQGKAANSFTMELNARVETGDVTRYLHF